MMIVIENVLMMNDDAAHVPCHAGPKSAAFAILIHFSRQHGSVVVTRATKERMEVRIPVAPIN